MSAQENDAVPAFGSEIRKEFMLKAKGVEEGVFLNHGCYGSMPTCVHKRQLKYLEELESNPDIWFCYNVNKYLDDATAKLAEFLGGIQAKDTYLVMNLTKAINNIEKTFPLKSGDAVLVTSLTFLGVKKTTRAKTVTVEGSKIHMLDIKFPIKSEDEIMKKYEDFLNSHHDVKLAVIDHITSPSSVVMPVKRMTELLHKHGIVVIIDGAHVPGQMNVDIDDIDADFYTGNLHKWMFCPRSAAFIWTNPRRQHAWFRPLITAECDDKGIRDAFAYEGTKDDIPFLCTMDGIDYFNRIGGMEKISAYNTDLVQRAARILEKKWGTKRMEVPEHMWAPFMANIYLPFIKGFTDHKPANKYSKDPPYDEHHLQLQKLILDKYSIQVAVLIVDDQYTVRICASVYNTIDDYIRLADAVLEIAKELNK